MALIIFMETQRQDDKSQFPHPLRCNYHTAAKGLDMGILLITKSSSANR
jgi:hypothetical protein